jgi:hypothetical protein
MANDMRGNQSIQVKSLCPSVLAINTSLQLFTIVPSVALFILPSKQILKSLINLLRSNGPFLANQKGKYSSTSIAALFGPFGPNVAAIVEEASSNNMNDVGRLPSPTYVLGRARHL